MPYQIALERDEAGTLRIHCTCADAVFRAEDKGRFCKHVRGLLHIGRRDQFEGDALPLGA
jgi:predicted nucleic acid-binding Zn finger protein